MTLLTHCSGPLTSRARQAQRCLGAFAPAAATSRALPMMVTGSLSSFMSLLNQHFLSEALSTNPLHTPQAFAHYLVQN